MEADRENDLELIRKTAEGDENAFDELVHRYEDTVYSTVYRYVGDSDEAKDLAQEVFLKVWKHADSFRGRSKFSTWLYRIAVNQCLNHRRKKGALQMLESIQTQDHGIASPQEEVARRRELEAVKRAIDGLPGRQRLALILSTYEGKRYKEIAEIMGVTVSAVESLIHRARRELRRMLLAAREKEEG